MIVVRLQGGLGNQMFQYAVARAVARRNRTAVKLDFRWINRDVKRCFLLGAWNIRALPASVLDMGRIVAGAASDHFLKPYLPYYARRIVREQANAFDFNILKARRHCLLIGFWQSEKYFAEIGGTLREDFTLRFEPSTRSRQVARTMHATNSVFVHVRRGDYVNDPQSSRLHGTCSLDYYQKAAAHIAREVAHPKFFVFSDDPRWLHQNFNLGYPVTIVDHNPPGDSRTPGQEHEDLWLMSHCRHAIVANSSFSWWGAWLNPNRNRIVIRPEQWVLDCTFEQKDLLPKEWVAI